MGVGTPERLIDELVRQSKRNLTHKLARDYRAATASKCERRQERRTHRTERRQERRTGRKERRTERRTGTKAPGNSSHHIRRFLYLVTGGSSLVAHQGR